MSILIINAGSSSVKFALFELDCLDPLGSGALVWPGETHRATVTWAPAKGPSVSNELDVPDYRSLAYHFGVNHAHTVIAGGEVVVPEA